ncbi:MAG: TM2 domain-containing protein [Acidobacteriota bacterium]|nr:TM2 domain-containing protein [Acidobacteriota bacterium]
MTAAQRALFEAELDQVRKDGTTGVLLSLFLGGIGLHHFYLGRWVFGVTYLLFVWTYVPMVLGLIEAFLMSSRVKAYNTKKAKLIEARILAAAESGRSLR